MKKISFNKIPHYISTINRLISLFFWSVVNNFNLLWWGVNKKGSIKSIGKLKVKKLPNTEITLGSNCRFLSKHTSNLIGINRPCILSTNKEGAKIIIGNNCGFSGTVIGAFELIEIGDNVRCGANTLITDSDWHLDDPRSSEPKPVIIKNNVWLGVNAVVLKGVNIGENTVIGANSVVSKNIPANCIAAGNPCKVIKEINVNE